MGYVNQIAFEIRAPKDMDPAGLDLLRRPQEHPDKVLCRLVREEIYAEADREAKIVAMELLEHTEIQDDNGTPVLRYYCTRYKGGSEIDQAGYLNEEITSAAGCSGAFMRLGEEPGDFEKSYWGPDESVYEAVLLDQRLEPQWAVYGVHLDVNDIRRLLGNWMLSDQDVARISESVLVDVRKSIVQTAGRLGFQNIEVIEI